MVDNDLDSKSPATPNRAGGVWVNPTLGLTPLDIVVGMSAFPCPQMTCPNTVQIGPLDPPNNPSIDEYLSHPSTPGPDGVSQCGECGAVVFGLESAQMVAEAREEHGDADPDEPPWSSRTGF